jgi:hypothetical protein
MESLAYLPTEQRECGRDIDAERRRRVEQYAQQLERSGLVPVERNPGAKGKRVRLLDVTDPAGNPLEFASLRRAASFLNEDPANVRKAARYGRLCRGTRVQVIRDAPREFVGNDCAFRVRLKETGDEFDSLTKAARALQVPLWRVHKSATESRTVYGMTFEIISKPQKNLVMNPFVMQQSDALAAAA